MFIKRRLLWLPPTSWLFILAAHVRIRAEEQEMPQRSERWHICRRGVQRHSCIVFQRQRIEYFDSARSPRTYSSKSLLYDSNERRHTPQRWAQSKQANRLLEEKAHSKWKSAYSNRPRHRYWYRWECCQYNFDSVSRGVTQRKGQGILRSFHELDDDDVLISEASITTRTIIIITLKITGE